jgi:phosphoribosylformylglycinamidine synthase
MDLMTSDFPQWEFEAEWTPPSLRGLVEPVLREPRDHGKLLATLLARPNMCSRNWIAQQYDHEVQGGSVIKPLVGKSRDMPSDAAVVRPLLSSNRGLAVSQALNPFYSQIDTYPMVAATMDEAVRKVVAVGGDPEQLGGVDNFCWPTIEYDPVANPDGKYKAAQLVRANWALRDFCLSYGIPLLSGKDSMYIDGELEGPYGERRRVSGLPTLLFTASTVVQDISQCVTMDAKAPGDRIYVVGETKNELGGSELYQMMGFVGRNVPTVDAKSSWPIYLALHSAIGAELIASCHAVSRGGLGVHLSMVAMGGELGVDVNLSAVPTAAGLTPTQVLYSESCGRFILTVPPDRCHAFEKTFRGLPVTQIGTVTETTSFLLRYGDSQVLIAQDIMDLKASWQRRFGELT